MFQSSPAPKDGRYREWPFLHQHVRVSILARPEGRALQYSFACCDHTTCVSILARPEGRALRDTTGGVMVVVCFNPRPPRRTGATMMRCPTVGLPGFQSSPAPKDGRYFWDMLTIRLSGCFNPRPPRRTGATRQACRWQLAAIVSILARPEGRALRSRPCRSHPVPRFQSSPAPKDGRY